MPAFRRQRGFQLTPRMEILAFALAIGLPLAALLAWTWYERIEDETRAAEARLKRIADASADRARQHVETLRTALAALAARPQVRAMDPARCDPALADLAEFYPGAGSIIVVDRAGTIACTSRGRPPGPAVRVADPGLHEEMLRNPQFRVSRPVTSRLSGRPIVSAVYPVRDVDGTVLGTVALGTDLQRWRPFPPPEALPEAATVSLVNAHGEVIARSHDAQAWVGRRFWDEGLLERARQARGGFVAGPGADGVERIFALAPVQGLDWLVLADVPEAMIATAARSRFARSGLTLAVAALGVMALSLYFGMRVFRSRAHAERALARHAERLAILHEIDRGMAAAESAEAIAAAVVRPLRELLGVPRAIVNRFDFERGEVEWIAAAGRRQVRSGPGVRYPLSMVGDVEALRRGEVQRVETRALGGGPHVDALLASGVARYMVVPMSAGGELLGAISFGGEEDLFPAEQVAIAQEVAAQLAIAMMQTRLLAQTRGQAAELERRVAERTAALDAALRELEDLYDRAPCGYHSVDADGLIVRMNATWLGWLGYRRDEVVGRLRHPDLMTPESARRFHDEVFPRFRRDGVLDGVEFEYRRKDGSTFTGQLNATSIHDEQGRYLMSRSTVFDVSARKKAEERMAALNKELESFSYSVSHDLRAPLRAIDGYARMLDEDSGAQLGEEGRRLLGVVRSSARRMGRLIDDLLEFARLGQLEPARARLDMAALAREAAADLAGEHPRTVVEIEALPAAHADRALFKQVWANLLGNAFKYSAQREAPRVLVRGREESGRVVYSVSDNGVGFDMRYAGKLFGVFQRLHRQDEFPGTGVGLAIVQRIVTRHGGRVGAEAKPGEGATFWFSLPVQ